MLHDDYLLSSKEVDKWGLHLESWISRAAGERSLFEVISGALFSRQTGDTVKQPPVGVAAFADQVFLPGLI